MFIHKKAWIGDVEVAYPDGPPVRGRTRVPPGGMEWAQSTAKPIPPSGDVEEACVPGKEPAGPAPRRK